MPAADAANSTPTTSSSARSALAAILRMLRLSVAPFSSRASSTDEIHSASIITSTTVTVPSIRLRTETWVLPIFQVI